jgi:hypothetical protein
MIEVLKQMQEALREYHYYTIDAGLPNQSMLNKGYAAYQAGLKAIAELESQEPVAYINVEKRILEWAKLTSWETPTVVNLPKIPLFTHPPQRTEQNFCSRCGKRTNDIHTCTPPQENT